MYSLKDWLEGVTLSDDESLEELGFLSDDASVSSDEAPLEWELASFNSWRIALTWASLLSLLSSLVYEATWSNAEAQSSWLLSLLSAEEEVFSWIFWMMLLISSAFKCWEEVSAVAAASVVVVGVVAAGVVSCATVGVGSSRLVILKSTESTLQTWSPLWPVMW